MGNVKRILCYGDSNTFGYIPGRGGRYNRHTRWPGLLSDLLGEGFLVVEEGLCGRTTMFDDMTDPGRSGLETMEAAIKKRSPLDLLIVMLGSNDCKLQFQASAKEIAEGVGQVIERAKSCGAGEFHVLLIAPAAMTGRIMQSGFGSEFNLRSVEVSGELAGEYEALAERLDCHFLDASKVTRVSETDGLHLDEQGHRLLAEAVCAWAKKDYTGEKV
ncbi:MAG: SGNH/GDSL hydrolase family protein [Lachnospiraceae bacterium]|nr:SGNH/GDSL hydrolase family protein [Lachnospiraceae bacterium]